MIYFDIETTALKNAKDYLQVPAAPANYKDPDKIKAFIEERQAEQLLTAALDPDLGQIESISWSKNGVVKDINTWMVGDKDIPDEKNLLARFWSVYETVSVGYNTIGFDLPFLQRRSMALGVTAPMLRLAKYQVGPIYDLMGIMYNWGPAKGLKWTCKRYGIKNPMDGVDGSMYATMTKKQKKEYSANDVMLTIELTKLMNGVYFSL